MKFKARECENPNCRTMFSPKIPNQRVCPDEECQRWKARENRRAFRLRREQEHKSMLESLVMPTRGEGCMVGSIQWCPFPGVTCW